ncbi:MAG: multicopper oxidase domain-containing protein [Deltaproteobacteria bacterium]|nr:multicopper oxidase domain-containing protein [Deltaproteobacteria bacterium]
MNFSGKRFFFKAALLLIAASIGSLSGALAAPLPGGTLDPTTIPKFVIPLVIPPVMKNSGTEDNYDIAVREFKQQILPGGIWNILNGRTDAFPATPVWSYGPAADPRPDAGALGIPAGVAPAPNSQFNYPAYTLETVSNSPVNVKWLNELVAINPATGFPYPVGSPSRTFLPHLLPIDQTLHWANPPATGCSDGTDRTDCFTDNPAPYTGPVPIIVHVHGAHVAPHSDGYPEAWYLPAAFDIPAGYATRGSNFDQAPGAPLEDGAAQFLYRNDQPATTIWYHDHSLGMTRSNVYAGPAGFWLVRGGVYDGAIDGTTGLPAVLPGPAPTAGQTVLQLNVPGDPVRNAVREIPIAIQDRSFNSDGSLFYPGSRAFFDGFAGPYIPDLVPNFTNVFSDISPIWNPEAFFNTMVVNGSTWPVLEVAPALYRFRLLNGCNSRFLNLSLFVVRPHPKKSNKYDKELAIYQIGAEQGFLPQVVQVLTGYATPLPGDGTMPKPKKAASKQQALLMGLAERADVLVDFSGLPDGTRIRMINTAPDAPFGGFPDVPADPATTGQVMEFVVNSALLQPADVSSTSPLNLVMNSEATSAPLGVANVIRKVSLNEEESSSVCVDAFNAVIPDVLPPLCGGLGVPAAPKAAKLGLVGPVDPLSGLPTGMPMMWADAITEKPVLNDIEEWEIHNFTVDAHPIHLHLVRFQVISRTLLGGTPSPNGVTPWEAGFKDSVIAYPGEITRIKAKFDIPGLFVWHCHIVEHEDNEMMRAYCVDDGVTPCNP